MTYTTGTLTGTFTHPDGTPHKGTVEIIPNSGQIIDADGHVILAGRVKIALDDDGKFTVDLPATDDPGLNPPDRAFTVVAKLHSAHLSAVAGEVPAGETTHVDTLTTDVATVASLAPWLTEVEYDALVARVAELEAGGGGGPSDPVSWDAVTGKPTTFPPSAHLHDDRYYTETEVDGLLAGKQTAGSYVTPADVSTASTADRARANHTGTQPATTITGLATVATSGAKSDVGLGNVDNTADTAKPVSTAQAAADTAVQTAAATDATTKANAAQAAAVQRGNHTGTQSLDTTTDSATRLALTTAERTKLGGVATGATANSSDAQLRDRSTHTGTQSATTVTGLAAVATSGSKADVGLGSVDNTSDADKPISTAQAAATAAARALALSPTLARPASPSRAVITEFETGHGFTITGTASSSTSDTTDYVSGTRSVYGVSNGAAGTANITRSNFGPFDFTGGVLEVLMKVTNTNKLGRIQFLLGNNNFATYGVQAVQGVASVPGEWIPEAEWTWVAVPWTPTFDGVLNRAAVTDIRIAWADNNTGTGVKMQVDSIRIRQAAHPAFPNGVAVLTFDDTIANQFTAAKPIMDVKGFPGVAYIIEDNVGASGFMTTAQLRSLERDSGWEIAAHSKSTVDHNATGGLTSLTTQQVTDNFTSLKSSVMNQGYRGQDHFAHPQGLWNATTQEQAARFFRTGRLAAAPRASELLPPVDPLKLRAWTVQNNLSEFQTIVDQAKLSGAAAIFVFHSIQASVTNPVVETSTANFSAMMDYLAASGMPVRTLSDVMNTLAPVPAVAAAATASGLMVDPMRTSEVATINRREASGSAGGGNGSVMAGLAECKTAGTFTQIRVWCSNAGSAVTGFKMGVWSADGTTLLAETAHGVPTANTWITRTLTTPITLTAGQKVYLGVGNAFTTSSAQVRAIPGPGFGNYWPTMTNEGLYSYRAAANGSWAGGSNALPGNLALNTGPAALPLVELVP